MTAAIAAGRAFVLAHQADPSRIFITDMHGLAELVARLCAEAEAAGRRYRPGWRANARAGGLGRKLGSPSAPALAGNKPKSRVSAAVTSSPIPQRMRRRPAPSPRPR